MPCEPLKQVIHWTEKLQMQNFIDIFILTTYSKNQLSCSKNLWFVIETCISNLQVRGDVIIDFIIIDEKKKNMTQLHAIIC